MMLVRPVVGGIVHPIKKTKTTPSVSVTPTGSPEPSSTAAVTPTKTPTPTVTPTVTGTAAVSPTPSGTPPVSPTGTPEPTPTSSTTKSLESLQINLRGITGTLATGEDVVWDIDAVGGDGYYIVSVWLNELPETMVIDGLAIRGHFTEPGLYEIGIQVESAGMMDQEIVSVLVE